MLIKTKKFYKDISDKLKSELSCITECVQFNCDITSTIQIKNKKTAGNLFLKKAVSNIPHLLVMWKK